MNIFVLDYDPQTAAEYMCDKHVPKMIVETFQMMGSAVRRHGGQDHEMPLTNNGKPLIGGYRHHPCTVWCGDNRSNFYWLGLHGLGICNEFINRFGKTHSCHSKIDHLLDMCDKLPSGNMTPFAQAMPDEYRDSNAVSAYRKYYKAEKATFAKWEKGRLAPDWW